MSWISRLLLYTIILEGNNVKKALLLAPMSSVHERFNKINIDVLNQLQCEIHIAANFEWGTAEAVQHNLLYKKQLESQGIITHQMPFQRSSLIKNLAAIMQCRNFFEKEKFAIIHAHTETGGLITRMARPWNDKTKYLFTPHGMSFYKGSSLKTWLLYYPVERWICSRMSAVLAMNKEEFDMLEAWNKDDAKYIHGFGLDVGAVQNISANVTAKRAQLGIPQDAFLILAIGELNENKNHETIIRALAKIPEQVYCLICGEGPLKKHLEEICTLYGLSDRVIFAGYRRDIIEIIHSADLFAFPSYHEGLPVSLMEAMAAGLPVVCSGIRGNVDLIEEGKGGFLCKPDDIDSFADRMRVLICDEGRKRQMGATNMENVKKFSKDVVFFETRQIYEEILQ
jgi:glycosyltransferase involved in cell wall biosynthesis